MGAHDVISVVSDSSQDGGCLLMVVVESSNHSKVKDIAGCGSAEATALTSINDCFLRLANTLQGFNLLKPEILTFIGKSTEYCKFIVYCFEINTENK